VQAYSRWSQPQGTLGAIVREAEARSDALSRHARELHARARDVPAGPSLELALRGGAVGVLAEVKRRSPSKGVIAGGLEAVEQARAYAKGGAAAVSILTEPVHFDGSNDDLTAVRAVLAIPALKKDFHVGPLQLVEARALGASAALLIARALSPELLRKMVQQGRVLGLELLVEVRDEEELDRAVGAGATMIGVNNRNLETLEIDPSTCKRILPLVPAELLAVAESGVRSRADVECHAAAGADAVLVGSVLSASTDPATATRALTGVPRRGRGR
jgi:indole-3-glycerol phosphate synthase